MEEGITRYRVYRVEEEERQARLAEERRKELLARKAEEEKDKKKKSNLRNSSIARKATNTRPETAPSVTAGASNAAI